MPGNIIRETVGTTLTQAEYEVADGGGIQFASQATGDVPYASSATVIEGLAIGSANQVLIVSGGIPAWSSNVNVQGTFDAQGAATLVSTLDVTGAVTLSSTIQLDDSQGVLLGTGSDASLAYDGTDLVISPAVVGTGDVVISGGSLELDDSESLTLGTGKDATLLYDGTDLLINPQAVGSGRVHVTNGGMLIGTLAIAAEAVANDLIVASGDDSGVSIQGSSTSNIHFGDAADADIGKIVYNHSGNSLQFVTNTAVAATIDSSQHIGIGTATPDGTLHAFSASAGTVTAAAAADDLIVENSGAGGITILTPNNVNGGIFFGDADDNDVGQLVYNHNIGHMFFTTETAARGYWDAKGLTISQSTSQVNRSTTNGTNTLRLFNGTAPAGTLTNGVQLYSASGELRVMDAAGNSTLLSPHDENGSWIYHSDSPQTGKRLVIQMEQMMKALNTHFGWDFIEETEL